MSLIHILKRLLNITTVGEVLVKSLSLSYAFSDLRP